MFYQYLAKNKLAPAAQILAAIDHAVVKRIPIGQIAIELGLLSIRDIFRILNHQDRLGCQFGECAVELDLLSNKDLNNLLKEQEKQEAIKNVFLNAMDQYLLDTGVLTRANLKNAREASTQPGNLS